MARRAVAVRAGAGMGIAAGVLAGVLAACGYGGGGTSSSASPSKGTTVNVTLKDFTVGLPTHTFKAGDYTFVAKNNGPHQHALEVEGHGVEKKTQVLNPGQSANLVVKLKDGTYKVYCPVDAHAAMGMKTMIKVTGSSPSGSTTSPSGGGGGY